MNTLIIGGLFALALLAILGLVFLLRSEPHTPKTPITRVDNEPLKVSETAQVAAGGAPTQPGLPAPKEEGVAIQQIVPVQQEGQRFPVANGQFHKLSIELHALHGQAQEIEHRLSILTEMIERIEHDQSHYVSVDEKVSHSTEQVSAN
ncbi:MAG: hypothetical protein NVS4B1_32310 [Ktedonobacteraceae bacterium]